MNFISSSLIDDRKKNPNTFILKQLIKQEIIHQVLNSFIFLIKQFNEQDSSIETQITSESCCILHSLTSFFLLIRKLLHYDGLIRAPMTTLMRTRGQDTYDTNITTTLQKMILKISHSLLLPFELNLFQKFPLSIQLEWFNIVEEMFENLKLLKDSTRKGDNNGNNSLKGSLKSQLSDIRSMFDTMNRVRDRDESLQSPSSSHAPPEDNRLLEAAAGLDFTPIQVIDAITSIN